MQIDTKILSDEEIIALVTCFDRQGLPLERRFQGDDDILREFVNQHGVNQLAANFAIVLCVLLREATIRGLTIPPVN
jgi:hypothetical protein